jgi:hypothetical protein
LPISYHVDSAGLLIITASSPLTGQDFLSYFRASRDFKTFRTEGKAMVWLLADRPTSQR